MPAYDNTSLWQQALGARVDDAHSRERERLRVAYENIRMRVKPIAEAIAIDLPDYTVHDITHLDALWEYADLIAGSNYPVNPCEAFVLGCAFLLHDLGMGLAAYPEGLAGLKKLELWKDVVADLLRKQGVEEISDQAIEGAAADIQKQAVGEALRQLHAERADKLGLIHWKSPTGEQQFHLIEDPELRESFGPTIGRIAFSHWWFVDQLAGEFFAVMGAQVGFPQSWTVDPLKLACVLRCADFAHVDERRAPAFLRALRQPTGVSDDHWKFQAKLYQPRLEGDRLIYTAKSGFSIDDAGAWWVCFDTLNAIDSELRTVDSLLADTHRERFAARGVSQSEEPSRLAKLIKTDGWQPVDTRIRVSAVADLVGKLGGQDLYGETTTPPLREMIQNAADAVRARRLIDDRAVDWGEIRVTAGKDDSGVWIQVEDSGVGMSEAVLTGPLLDFGASFWGSTLMHDQLPGLAATGFQATGRYGIGFFSVFMWGERVEVTTQRFDKGRADTLVLSFKKGLKERPLLRPAQPSEHITDGGTRVKIWLADENTLERLISTHTEDRKLTLAQVCAGIAPCLDVTLKAEGNSGLETAVAASDWLTVTDESLLSRIAPLERPMRNVRAEYSQTASPTLQTLKSTSGRPVGRVAIWKWDRYFTPNRAGIVTVGGLRACTLAGIIGVFVGTSKRAARDSAVPTISIPNLKEWVEKERDARLREGHPPDVLTRIAEVVSGLGVEPNGLPIARTDSGWVTVEQIESLAVQFDEVLLVQDAAVELAGGKVLTAQLSKGVFAIEMGMMSILHSQTRFWHDWPPVWPPEEQKESEYPDRYYPRSIEGTVIRALARGWRCSIQELLSASSFGSDEETFEREIGTLADNPYLEHVNIIRHPSARGSSDCATSPQRE